MTDVRFHGTQHGDAFIVYEHHEGRWIASDDVMEVRQ